MIEWKQYDRNNPPILYRDYLVNHSGVIISGCLTRADNCRLTWYSYNGHILTTVTHYAEINWPEAIGSTESAQADK